MLATHNSFTYDKPRNPLLNLISIFWKCQKLDIQAQYDLGVRIFDIRVSKYNNGWCASHGLYKAKNIKFETISDICKYFKVNFPDSYIRIYLEDSLNNIHYLDIVEIYKKECNTALHDYKDIIWEYGTHHPWKTYFRNDNLPFKEIKEYYCHLFNWNPDRNFWYNVKNFDWSSWCIPLYSKKHNPRITKEIIEDDTMHIMDYIGVYPK